MDGTGCLRRKSIANDEAGLKFSRATMHEVDPSIKKKKKKKKGNLKQDKGTVKCCYKLTLFFSSRVSAEVTKMLTLGIMLSQLAAVVCKVLIQAGRGSLSLLFLL